MGFNSEFKGLTQLLRSFKLWHNLFAQYTCIIKSKTKFSSTEPCYESCPKESYFYITPYCFTVKMYNL